MYMVMRFVLVPNHNILMNTWMQADLRQKIFNNVTPFLIGNSAISLWKT